MPLCGYKSSARHKPLASTIPVFSGHVQSDNIPRGERLERTGIYEHLAFGHRADEGEGAFAYKGFLVLIRRVDYRSSGISEFDPGHIERFHPLYSLLQT